MSQEGLKLGQKALHPQASAWLPGLCQSKGNHTTPALRHPGSPETPPSKTPQTLASLAHCTLKRGDFR